MSDQDISALMDFGFTLLQARVYVELLRLGRTRASKLSSALGLVRPEAYRVLHELAAKGVVQKNLGSPSTYSAVAPRDALALLAQKYNDQLSELARKQDMLVKSLSTLGHAADTHNEGLTLIMGGGNLISRTREMIARAKHDYVGIRSRFGLKRVIDNGIADAIIAAKKRNLNVRVISEIDASNVKSANYLSCHVELRRARDLLFYMDIVDGAQMVFGPAFPLTDEEARRLDERELDLWTSNPNFVRGMHSMFDRLWATCPRYRARVHS